MKVPARVNGELSESFKVKVGVRQGCVMSPWLFNNYIDGCIREMKVRVRDLGARLNVRGVEQPLVVGLYAESNCCLVRIVSCYWYHVTQYNQLHGWVVSD